MPDLRIRYDAHDRRILREYLKHTVQVYPPTSNDEDGEDVYANSVAPIRCHIDTSRRRFVNNRGENISIAATVTFDRDADVAINYVLRDGKNPIEGIPYFSEVRAEAFDPIDHTDRGRLTKTLICMVH